MTNYGLISEGTTPIQCSKVTGDKSSDSRRTARTDKKPAAIGKGFLRFKHIILSAAMIACLVLLPVMNSMADTGFVISGVNLATDEELEDALQQIMAEKQSRIKTTIALNAAEVSIAKGKTQKLAATVEDLPEGVTAGKFEWSTDDPAVATVQNGNVKAVDGGMTVIHCAAKLSNEMIISTDCRVTVIVPVSKIIYNKNALTMKVGETYTPSFSFSPDNASNTALAFETSNPDVATVENGTITAHNGGNVKITATTTDGSNKKAVISIKVVSTFSGEFVTFNPKMMKSVSSQISEATDLTMTGNNRAVLAALLTLEYQYQCPNKTIDFTKPILVSKSGTMAACAFAIQGDYVMVIFQMHPLGTSYGYLGDGNAPMAKAALEMISDDVWTVPLKEYNTKLEFLIQQFN